MKGIFATTVMFLTACAATTPVQRADGSYMVSARVPFTGQSGAKSKALEHADGFCQLQGKTVQFVSDTSQECALHGGCGEAEIIFNCVKPQ
jgi:hypothetical protein